MLDPRTVSSPYVRTLLAVFAAHGVDVAGLRAELGLVAAVLDDPSGRIAPERVHRLWERALALTGNPLLGLEVARAARPATFRTLGLAVLSSSTLRAAMTLMLRCHRLVSESGTLTARREPDGDITLLYTEQLLRLHLFAQQVEAIVGGILVLARDLAERTIVPLAVSFQHPAPGDPRAYQGFFGCPVQFNAADNALRLSAADLDCRLPQADAELHGAHCALLERQLAALTPAGSVSAFASQWLKAQTSGAMRIDHLAQAMGMSVRALQRRLREEAGSWTALVDSARRDVLERLLLHGASLEEAARQLGYHDASSLSRAARRWFGTTPAQWREANVGPIQEPSFADRSSSPRRRGSGVFTRD